MLLIVVVIAMSLLIEGMARVVFRDLMDDERFEERALARILNSQIAPNAAGMNYSKRFGFRYKNNSLKTFSSDEFSFTARTNSIGYRTKELVPREQNELRVLMVGDSMFWGQGVNEDAMISSVLERAGLSVYNYAVSGYNTVQELLVIEEHLDKLQADHVILGLFIANDVVPNYVSTFDGEGNFSVDQSRCDELRTWIKDAMGFWYHTALGRSLADIAWLPRLRYAFALKPEVLGETVAYLSRAERYVTSRGAAFSVVIIYPRDGIDDGLQQKWSKSRDVGAALLERCAAKGIATIDALQVMAGDADRQQYFFPRDGHFTAAGNRVIANSVLDNIVAAVRQAAGHDMGQSSTTRYLPRQGGMAPPAGSSSSSSGDVRPD